MTSNNNGNIIHIELSPRCDKNILRKLIRHHATVRNKCNTLYEQTDWRIVDVIDPDCTLSKLILDAVGLPTDEQIWDRDGWESMLDDKVLEGTDDEIDAFMIAVGEDYRRAVLETPT